MGIDQVSIFLMILEKNLMFQLSLIFRSIWAEATGEVCDLVQVPAYLCRQTSILRAAAETKRPIHLKKGQYMSPWNMKNSVRKLESFGCDQILLTDRGTFLDIII